MPRIAPVLTVCLVLVAAAQAGTVVTMDTNLGRITIELLNTAAPGTCRNFLDYVESGAYDNMMFHRSVDDFVLQTGGFASDAGVWDAIPVNAPIVNEFGTSNTRGTVGMAKLGGDPDSATSQFFFNLIDNSANLDFQNGGFTVFAEVTGGMDIVDAIGDLTTYDLRSYFSSAPWAGAMGEVPMYTDGGGVQFFIVTTEVVPEPATALVLALAAPFALRLRRRSKTR